MFIKKYWYIITLLAITLGLGVVTFLTSQQLSKVSPVAPNVPQVKPKAASEACTISFSIAQSATPTPTSAVGACNTVCGIDSDCQSWLICSHGFCRNPSCNGKADCTCIQPTNTPTVVPSSTPVPTATSTPNPSGTPVPTATPVPILGCNYSCTSDSQCQSGLVCSGGYCRNNNCTEQSNCTCVLANTTPTPTILLAMGPTATPVPPTEGPSPKTPVSGNPTVTILSIAVAGIFLIFGLAL
jgi:hypothetical protein